MQLTIGYLTGRPEPHVEWFLESLGPQLEAGDQIELLVVDLRGRSPEQLGIASVDSRIQVRAVTPKPTPWQGPHRLTQDDWWAKSSAINTAIVLCKTSYAAFTDDCCRVGPRWLAAVRRGERERRSVLAGTYDKIERGVVVQDHRRGLAPEGKENCGGGWLYGCTYALPIDWAVEVNGAEEGCDGMGYEDCIFGLMLENAGHRIDFVPDMHVIQSRQEAAPSGGPSVALRREDKGVSPNDKSHVALARFRKLRRTEFSPALAPLRAQFLATGEVTWPLPDPDLRDWYDGQLVREFG